MKIIAKPRQQGKTTEMIKISAEKNIYIACLNQREAQRIFSQAKYMGLKIPYPVTFDNLLDREYFAGSMIKDVLIDNADRLLEYIVRPLYISAASFTEDKR